MRLIDVDKLKELEPHHSEDGYRVFYEYEIDKAPTVKNIISATDFKKRLNNMEYVYLQACYEDVIDAIDCEVTYFKEKGGTK